ncbi:hypothetical protein IG193_02180 [Infirmifilum lucidum]|uniref:ABC3 transporter permease protein domain-containing protein n=1 Tax=Infirmifilum lucidum TaxID=2776706 RepID=A0A7L9FJV7_9CREN|nr:hypothetical protein [Infirmifilum lucidum]QOJ79293.1 hypothetical protein IG193_02180 [Infirmifilum lucidum]
MRILAEVARVLGFKLHLLIILQVLVMELAIIASGSLLLDVQNFYDSILDARGPSVVVTSISLAPFTSIVDVDQLRGKLKGVEGVALEERVYALVKIQHSSAILVGLEDRELGKIASSDSREANCVFVGEDLAHKLGLAPGMDVVAYSPYTSLPYVLRICGFAGRQPYSWMLVSRLELARSLRGLRGSQASVVVVHSEGGAEAVLGALGISSARRSIGERIFLAVRSTGGNFSARLYSAYAGEVLERLGVPVEVFYAVVVTVCATLAVSASMLGGFVLSARARELAVLRLSGASSRALRASLILMLLAYSLLGGVLSSLVLSLLPLELQLLGFGMKLGPKPAGLVAGVVLVWGFASASIARGEAFE